MYLQVERPKEVRSEVDRTEQWQCSSYPAESGEAQPGRNQDFPDPYHWSVAQSPLEGDTSNRLSQGSSLEQAWSWNACYLHRAGREFKNSEERQQGLLQDCLVLGRKEKGERGILAFWGMNQIDGCFFAAEEGRSSSTVVIQQQGAVHSCQGDAREFGEAHS